MALERIAESVRVGSNTRFEDDEFQGAAALFMVEDEPASIEDENGNMESMIGTPDCWSRPQDIYIGSEVRLVGAKRPQPC